MTTDLKTVRVYTDGIFDLFHRGHIEYLNKCKNLDVSDFGNNVLVHLIAGIINDKDSTGYKRKPIYCEDDRYKLVESVKDVPLFVSKEFLDEHNIDIVVHGFSNEADAQKQKEFFAVPNQLGIFRLVPYCEGISTTDIIKTIKDNY